MKRFQTDAQEVDGSWLLSSNHLLAYGSKAGACHGPLHSASVIPRLEGQAGLPLGDRFKFLPNKRQHLMAKNAKR